MQVEHVEDATDPRLRDFTGLRDVALRSVREPEEGMFLAEGEKTIRRALEVGYELRGVLCTERWLPALDALIAEREATAYVVDDEVLADTTGFPVHRGAIASFRRRELPSLNEVLDTARRVVVLEDVQDHTNLGAIFRSAAALSVDAVVLTPRSADPLYRRTIRTSMGAVFAVPWTRTEWHGAPRLLKEAGFSLVALTPASDATPLPEIDVAALGTISVMLGNEGDGLSGHYLRSADVRARIPMREGVDSLNVAAAAAVALYGLRPID